MAFFISATSKFNRAMRALLVLQGKGTWDDSFINADSRLRNVLPNRTYRCSQFTPDRPHRPEGVVSATILHHFQSAVQPGEDIEQRRIEQDAYLGDTMDTLNMDGDGQQGCPKLAQAITDAGRWLAQTDGTPEGDLIAAKNADMANFRVDWVKFSQPLIVSGESEHASTIWVEVVNFTAFVSHASA